MCRASGVNNDSQTLAMSVDELIDSHQQHKNSTDRSQILMPKEHDYVSTPLTSILLAGFNNASQLSPPPPPGGHHKIVHTLDMPLFDAPEDLYLPNLEDIFDEEDSAEEFCCATRFMLQPRPAAICESFDNVTDSTMLESFNSDFSFDAASDEALSHINSATSQTWKEPAVALNQAQLCA